MHACMCTIRCTMLNNATDGHSHWQATDIAYQSNRAVIFSSFFFHQTMPHRFKSGHVNRRINLTYLFGDFHGILAKYDVHPAQP